MVHVINTNLMPLNAQRNLTTTQGALATSIQRLSTGLRVNGAKDRTALNAEYQQLAAANA